MCPSASSKEEIEEADTATELNSSSDALLDVEAQQNDIAAEQNSNVKLIVFFILLVLTGAANAVVFKLQAIPMYNYANYVNVFANAAYAALTFVYIIPVARYGWFNNAISAEQMALSKKPYAIIGLLDCFATSLQIFSAFYLPGPLLILLQQAAIPISMFLSSQILGSRYRWFQYVGAIVVIMGILVVLEPVATQRHAPEFVCEAIDMEHYCTICQVEMNEEDCLSHQNNTEWITGMETGFLDTNPLCRWVKPEKGGNTGLILMWSGILIFSCVPMTLSGIYKEITVTGEVEMDPVYINGWICLFQTFYSIFFAVPAGLLLSPTVGPLELPKNFYDGIKCYFGKGTITTGCHPDDLCDIQAATFLNLGVVVSLAYTVSILLVLKYGSANLLYLALTAAIPVGNLAFALPFMPQRAQFHASDILGLCVIMGGLILYRFAGSTDEAEKRQQAPADDQQDAVADLSEPLLADGDSS